MAPKGYWQARCARCGHPRGKHTHRPSPGCTMGNYRRRTLASGRNVTTRSDCECTGFVERAG